MSDRLRRLLREKTSRTGLVVGALVLAGVLVAAVSLHHTAGAQHFAAKVERGDIHRWEPSRNGGRWCRN